MNTPHEKDKSENRLNFISPRLTPRMQRAQQGRGAFVVKKLRVVLPAIVLLVVAVLFLWPIIRPNFVMKDIAKNIPNLVIENLHYKGMDDKNQAYSVSAAEATRPSNLHGIYDLTKPEAEITLQSGAWLNGKSDYGRYDNEGKRLWLGGNVHLFHDKGYEFTTDEAQINLNNNDAWGERPVLLQGGFGTVRGQGFRFLDGGKTIVFDGPATAVLRLHSHSGSDKP